MNVRLRKRFIFILSGKGAWYLWSEESPTISFRSSLSSPENNFSSWGTNLHYDLEASVVIAVALQMLFRGYFDFDSHYNFMPCHPSYYLLSWQDNRGLLIPWMLVTTLTTILDVMATIYLLCDAVSSFYCIFCMTWLMFIICAVFCQKHSLKISLESVIYTSSSRESRAHNKVTSASIHSRIYLYARHLFLMTKEVPTLPLQTRLTVDCEAWVHSVYNSILSVPRGIRVLRVIYWLIQSWLGHDSLVIGFSDKQGEEQYNHEMERPVE